MSLYRRLSELHEKNDIEAFAAELIDRFGPLPEEVENLLQIDRDQAAVQAPPASTRLDGGPKGAVIGFHADAPPNVPGLMQWIQGKAGTVKLRPDQKLVAVREWHQPAQRVQGVRTIMRDLAALGVAA